MKNPRSRSSIEILETRIAPSTVDVVGGVLIFTAGAGETNTIDFRIQSGAYPQNFLMNGKVLRLQPVNGTVILGTP